MRVGLGWVDVFFGNSVELSFKVLRKLLKLLEVARKLWVAEQSWVAENSSIAE